MLLSAPVHCCCRSLQDDFENQMQAVQRLNDEQKDGASTPGSEPQLGGGGGVGSVCQVWRRIVTLETSFVADLPQDEVRGRRRTHLSLLQLEVLRSMWGQTVASEQQGEFFLAPPRGNASSANLARIQMVDTELGTPLATLTPVNCVAVTRF